MLFDHGYGWAVVVFFSESVMMLPDKLFSLKPEKLSKLSSEKELEQVA